MGALPKNLKELLWGVQENSGINYSTDPRFSKPSESLSSTAKASAAAQDSRFLNSSNSKTSTTANTTTTTSSENKYKDENGQTLNAPSYARGNIKTTTPTTNEEKKEEGDLTSFNYGSYTPKTATFTPSETYVKAMEYTNQLLEQLSSGRTSYTEKINSIMESITNRDKFSYDPQTDALFQNMLSGYMNSGQLAMQDTMGQAAGLTGGYGSSYATSAANQAYNSYLQDAYANLPDYYQLALDAYNQEGQELYNQLGMYQTMDDTEYSRLANAYSANAQKSANLYDQEYNNFWQTQNFNSNERQFAANMAYKSAMAKRDQENWQSEYALNLLKASQGEETTEGPNYSVAKNTTAVNAITKAFEENGYEGGMAALRKYDAQLTDDDLDWFVNWAAENGYTEETKKKGWFFK